MNDKIITWLFDSDPSIKWQVMRDLLNVPEKEYSNERAKIEFEGWGRRLLSFQNSKGIWGNGIYSPKWISSTYTLLLLKSFGLNQNCSQAQKGIMILLEEGFYGDGGINVFGSLRHSETCVTGMILSLLSYFKINDSRIINIAEFLLNQQMKDGGWNCQSFNGATHSSFHTTISVLEGLKDFNLENDIYGNEIIKSREKAIEFLLEHQLYKSHRTGKVVDDKMIRLTFPPRWRYDILRCLDFFRECHVPKDERMNDAIKIIKNRRKNDGLWIQNSPYPGQVFFEMEETRKPSRWNTMRALRVLNYYAK